MVLEVELNQQRSVGRFGCSGRVRWHIINQVTPFALMIILQHLSKLFQQKRQNNWDSGAGLSVHGLDVFAEAQWVKCGSTNQASGPEKVPDGDVSPECGKLTVQKAVNHNGDCGMVNGMKELL